MKLHQLPNLKGSKRAKKRRGRGYGSGKGGHTVGKGQKGQKVRGRVKLGFEGGQLPLVRRLPHKRGFKRVGLKRVTLNVSKLTLFEDGAVVDEQTLLRSGLIDKIPKGGVKILGKGKVHKGLKIRGIRLSKLAEKKLEKAGGSRDD